MFPVHSSINLAFALAFKGTDYGNWGFGDDMVERSIFLGL